MNYNNEYDDDNEDRPSIPAPKSLNRETADPWFVLDEEEKESKLKSPEAKIAMKQIMSILVSLTLFGLLIYGGWTLWEMFMGIWGEA